MNTQLLELHVPFVPLLLHASLCVDGRGLYQFLDLLAEAALVVNIAGHRSNKHILFRQTRMYESYILSFYHLNELARGNAAHLDEPGRK